MSRKGENIYKRKDGRWEGRYVKCYQESGKIQYGYCYARTYREVKEKLVQQKRDLTKEKDPVFQDKEDFAYYCDEWLQLRKIQIKESSYVKYQNNLEKHIKPYLGKKKLDELNTLLLNEFTEELLHNGKLSAKTVHDILLQVKSILKYIEKKQQISFQRIDIIFPKAANREMRVLSREEQSAFVRYLITDMDACKFGILMALMTGLRIGELCALRWSDISLDENYIEVHTTMLRLKQTDTGDPARTRIVVSEPKSQKSRRRIPMPDFLASLCRSRCPADTNAFLLTESADRFMEPRTLQYRIEKYTRECQLEDVHFHTLRHSFATRCVELGFEIKTLSEILGHSTPKTTLDRYVHSSMELKRQNMNKLSSLTSEQTDSLSARSPLATASESCYDKTSLF